MTVLKYHWPNDWTKVIKGTMSINMEDSKWVKKITSSIKRFSKIQVHGNKSKKKKNKQLSWRDGSAIKSLSTLTEDLTSVHSSHKVAHN